VAEAIFGLVGVVVGALVTGGVEFLAERRRESSLRRKAARLVEAELDQAARALETALDAGRSWNPPSVPSWAEYAPVLADSLDTDDWQVVESAVGMIKIEEMGQPDRPPAREEVERESLDEEVHRVIQQAAETLRRLAGDE
jgi:hypothetical protein